jgi:hypothetical protein
MKRQVRQILIIIAVAAVVIVALAAVGPLLIPAATYQRAVERALLAKLDARVAIGKFQFRILPTPGYTIRQLSLISIEPPFQGIPLLTAKEVSGTLSLATLLRGKIETEIDARDVEVDVRFAEGVSNLGRMLRIGGGAQAPGSARDAGAAGAPPRGFAPLPLGPMPKEFRAMPAPTIAPPSAVPAPAPEPPAPPGPESRIPSPSPRFADLLIPIATAADTAASAAPGDEEDGRELSIRAVRILRGKVRIEPEGTAAPLLIDGVEVDARRRQAAVGEALYVRTAGRIAGEAGGAFGASGQLIVDSARRELTIRGARISFRGVPAALDASVGIGLSPWTVDLHAASPSYTAQALAPILAIWGKSLPLGLGWEGPVAVDLTFKGTLGAGQAVLQVDASGARILAAGALLKESGLACKFSARTTLAAEAWTLDEGTLTFGTESVAISGAVTRDPALTSRLRFSAEGLSLSALKVLMPNLALIGIPEALAVDVTASGSLAASAPLALDGKFRASRLEIAGAALGEVSGSFLRQGETLTIPTMRASFGGGAFSGNGEATLGASPALTFDAVIDRADLSVVPSAHGALLGMGSIVVRAEGAAGGPASGMTFSGTVIVPEGSFACGTAACGLFSDNTWGALSDAAKTSPDEATRRQLADAGPAFEEFRASFEMKQDALTLTDVTWTSALSSARLAVSITPDGRLAAEGTVLISPAVVAQLLPDPAARELLATKDGSLLLPVVGSGTPTHPLLSVEKGKLAAIVTEKLAAKAAEVLPPAKETKESKKAAAAAKAAPAAPAPAAPTTPAPAPQPAQIIAPPAAAAPVAPTAPAPAAPMTPQAAPPAAAAAAPTTPAPAQAPAPKPKKKAAAAPSEDGAEPTPSPKKSSPQKMQLQDTEDILKVIIGD